MINETLRAIYIILIIILILVIGLAIYDTFIGYNINFGNLSTNQTTSTCFQCIQTISPYAATSTSPYKTSQYTYTKTIKKKPISSGYGLEFRKIFMRENSYTQPDIVVRTGTAVIWENYDYTLHTVTSDSGVFGSGIIPTGGGTFMYIFNTPGIYEYHCQIHPGMVGKIIVK